jgi:deoxycytidine triphosphate deaminase
MILGSAKILDLVKKKGLVKNLSSRELNFPEGPGFDLRVGEISLISGQGFLGKEERHTASIKKTISTKQKDKEFTLFPGDFCLVSTIEEVKMGKNIFASVYPRSTLFRSGVTLLSGKVSPEYFGKLTFGLANLGPVKFTIELGARIAFIVFQEVKGKSNPSRGQWRGGRIVATKKEKQV